MAMRLGKPSYGGMSLLKRLSLLLCVGILAWGAKGNGGTSRPEDVAGRRPTPAPIGASEKQAFLGQLPLMKSGPYEKGELRHEDPMDLPTETAPPDSDGLPADSIATLLQMVDALDVMQVKYFELWQGTWPNSIDWTAAVLGTYLSGALTTLSTAFDYTITFTPNQEVVSPRGLAQFAENLVNKYFSQLTTFYFGQDAFGLRNQAYDDMLWVVLGWLESIKFINLHSKLHYGAGNTAESHKAGWNGWYGEQFIPAFGHRARVFYDLASRGWDTKLCGGGMVWNPYLEPYKNAITNELFIAASVSMYLYFPGDENSSPFSKSAGLPPAKAHDSKYLTAALEAYKWLSTSNMTNSEGLYVDGFHINGYGNGNRTHMNRNCDDRNEMVYTYNQGVLLTGHRGLWESTGASSFLDEGHSLLQSVIRGTGWQLQRNPAGPSPNRTEWAGLGRNGIMEEICDASSSCSQNGQTFKGIFFHHLTYFCSPLPLHPTEPGLTFAASVELKNLHEERCKSYQTWIEHNADAALKSKNLQGEYGAWWGDHGPNRTATGPQDEKLPAGAVDYRNRGLPPQSEWRGARILQDKASETPMSNAEEDSVQDVNDRGRGRTVETQGGGIAVVRAMWKMVDRKPNGA
ncbi:MAG: hypothetical protein M4579_002970 [Chaenotheca gracillima]|nr:MAG: hypothetical protein M4579_002970 [Chaenotheca gracillima]